MEYFSASPTIIINSSFLLLQKIYEKPKVSIQIIKNAKRNRYKRTNEH